jgi:hypothetical protein
VLAFRLHQPIYDQLVEAAADHKLSISEEAETRIENSFIWEQQFGDVKNLQEQNLKAMAGETRTFLLGLGYQPFSTSRGRLWAEPGVDLLSGPLNIEVDIVAALQRAMPKIVQAIIGELVEKAKEKGSSDEK